MDEQRIREIVREEIAKEKAAESAARPTIAEIYAELVKSGRHWTEYLQKPVQ